MKVIASLVFAFTVLATIASAAVSSSAEVAGPVPPLEGRAASACKASNCACNKVQGQFCGNQGINPSCTNGHVFECNKSTGKTCDYGVRDSCVKCGKLSC